MLKSGDANAVLVIQPGFAEAVDEIEANPAAFFGDGDTYQLGIVIDGSDANVAAAASSYAGIIILQYIKQKLPPGFVSKQQARSMSL